MIAGPYPSESRIVRTWPAAQTGESYYETDDGRVWKTTFSTPTITGVEYGSLEGDRITSPPRARWGYPSRVPQFFDRPKPFPAPHEVAEPPLPKPAPKRVLAALRSFVGAGTMHRRWR